MEYGKEPLIIGEFGQNLSSEYMFYMYLPVKMPGTNIRLEPRLEPFRPLIEMIIQHQGDTFDKYIYLTVKSMFHPKGLSHNRPNWHSDGFGTEDINYVLHSNTPTEFCIQEYKDIDSDDKVSLKQFEDQSKEENIKTYPNFNVIKITPENIHRIGVKTEDGPRLFVKVSVTPRQYQLKGNTHNYEFDYDWDLIDRSLERNTP